MRPTALYVESRGRADHCAENRNEAPCGFIVAQRVMDETFRSGAKQRLHTICARTLSDDGVHGAVVEALLSVKASVEALIRAARNNSIEPKRLHEASEFMLSEYGKEPVTLRSMEYSHV